jgi:single-strand DNA-binding protein
MVEKLIITSMEVNMAGLNKAMLIGNLGADPEIRYTASGMAVANFNIATSETWTGKDGQKETRTEWHRIVAFDRLGEICGEYLTKGKQVYIEGKIQTRQWEDRDGNKRYTTEIVARDMVMLGSRDEAGGGSRRPSSGRQSAPQDIPENPYPDSQDDDDIPF